MAASACRSKLMNRTSLSFLKSALKSTKNIQAPSLGARPAPAARRFSSFFGLPAELGCAQSLLPLHSAVAVARLTSCLTASSRSCRALSQERRGRNNKATRVMVHPHPTMLANIGPPAGS